MFLGAIQNISMHIDNHSAETDNLKGLLKKNKKLICTEHTAAFENSKPMTIRTDKATACTGCFFGDFCKRHSVKIKYGTPYIHNPTGLVERGDATLKENLTIFKAVEKVGKALAMSLEVMGKTSFTKVKKTAFKVHNGRKANTVTRKPLKLDMLGNLTKNSVSAKPDTLKVYLFIGASGVCVTSCPLSQRKIPKDKFFCC